MLLETQLAEAEQHIHHLLCESLHGLDVLYGFHLEPV
jgi:hypothetical protein